MVRTFYKNVPIHHYQGWHRDNQGWLTDVTGNTLHPTHEAAKAAIDAWWADPDRVPVLPSITQLSLTGLFANLPDNGDKND